MLLPVLWSKFGLIWSRDSCSILSFKQANKINTNSFESSNFALLPGVSFGSPLSQNYFNHLELILESATLLLWGCGDGYVNIGVTQSSVNCISVLRLGLC